MPNSSARCAQLPRAVDKVPFYAALKKFRDYLRGDIQELDESDVVFPEVKLQNFNNKRIKKEEFGEVDERMDGEDRIDPETGKKRRGRPPKPRPDGSLPAPKRRQVQSSLAHPIPKQPKLRQVHPHTIPHPSTSHYHPLPAGGLTSSGTRSPRAPTPSTR